MQNYELVILNFLVILVLNLPNIYISLYLPNSRISSA